MGALFEVGGFGSPPTANPNNSHFKLHDSPSKFHSARRLVSEILSEVDLRLIARVVSLGVAPLHESHLTKKPKWMLRAVSSIGKVPASRHMHHLVYEG
jgi:hypothetical protein